QALFSYLVAFLFWLTLGVGMLGWLGAFHAARARWMVVVRRLMETMTAPLALLIVLFIPLAIGAHTIYHWPEDKAFYFSVPFWVVRAAIYFTLFAAVSHFLRRWSVAQDTDGGLEWTTRMRRTSSVALPFVALALTFAAFDWVMSLHPDWQSTIFGLYVL